MSHIDLRGVKYIGADIVPALVQATAERFAHRPELRFLVVDLLADKLPPSDLVMVRDCLVHLSFADIHSAFNNLKASGARYLLTTTFTQLQENRDIVTGDWRPINLQQAPFNLPTPLVVIDEKCLDANGAYRDKSLALWELRNV